MSAKHSLGEQLFPALACFAFVLRARSNPIRNDDRIFSKDLETFIRASKNSRARVYVCATDLFRGIIVSSADREAHIRVLTYAVIIDDDKEEDGRFARRRWNLFAGIVLGGKPVGPRVSSCRGAFHFGWKADGAGERKKDRQTCEREGESAMNVDLVRK